MDSFIVTRFHNLEIPEVWIEMQNKGYDDITIIITKDEVSIESYHESNSGRSYFNFSSDLIDTISDIKKELENIT